MGWYSVSVYFLTAPTLLDVATALQTMTGFCQELAVRENNELFLTHPAHPAQPVMLSWSEDRLELHAHAEATLARPLSLPFSTYPFLIELSADQVNTRAHSYLRNTALTVLLRLGGRTEQPFQLPAWADHRWQDVPPRTFWQQVRSLWAPEF
ncbi:hypothetical protein [Hymenobacter sp. YC55]|uniref:hypothetical protein n=1 Tax=Hymenobacter sp. YC55 TaxID=3034019 RepID=UPI0023F66C41|nr:hypothetical protein [Hymenobacter sp. YC55]MDF7815721.1 hypothetical protein [Hymenobacter sp. YC55]